LEKTVNN